MFPSGVKQTEEFAVKTYENPHLLKASHRHLHPRVGRFDVPTHHRPRPKDVTKIGNLLIESHPVWKNAIEIVLCKISSALLETLAFLKVRLFARKLCRLRSATPKGVLPTGWQLTPGRFGPRATFWSIQNDGFFPQPRHSCPATTTNGCEKRWEGFDEFDLFLTGFVD